MLTVGVDMFYCRIKRRRAAVGAESLAPTPAGHESRGGACGRCAATAAASRDTSRADMLRTSAAPSVQFLAIRLGPADEVRQAKARPTCGGRHAEPASGCRW